MDASPRQPWFRTALLIGVAYFVIGRAFAAPTNHVHLWRGMAWLASAVAYAWHIGYEHFSLRNQTRAAALHVASAVAVGAFALAGAGALHSLSLRAGTRPLWLVALVAWPLVTAVPAFVVALVAGAVLKAWSASASRSRPAGR